MSDKSIIVQNNQGDTIGVGVYGNGNTIEKNITIFKNEVLSECGLSFLYPNYFKENEDIREDIQKWNEGFPLTLASIYYGKDYKRQNVIDEIKQKMADKKRLLILGESGTSKSIILMELICDYFKKDYKILYNLEGELKNENTIIDRIKGLVDAKNKVLIVVDNVHTEKTSKIFYVLKNLPTLYKNKDVLFLLAARQPEFKWMLERGTDSDIIEKIEFLFDIKNENSNNSNIYNVQSFTKNEIKEFIKKYEKDIPLSIKNKSIEENAKEIWKYTNGHPIMVRFSVFQNGLENHVKQIYKDFLIINKKPDSKEKIKTSIICSLFDISSIPITSNTLKDLSLYKFALDLESALLKLDIKTKTWKTIHPRWDLELLKYLFSITNLSDREDLDQCFLESIYSLLNLDDGKLNQINKIGIITSVYETIVINNFINIDKIDELLNSEEIAQKFDEYRKLLFFLSLSYSYGLLKKFDKSLFFRISL